MRRRHLLTAAPALAAALVLSACTPGPDAAPTAPSTAPAAIDAAALLAPFDLTHVQFVLLAVLASIEHTTPITQRDLATRAATDPMMTSQVLRALESKGLVERAPHPTDGRARILTITTAGIAIVNRANVAVEEADRAYFAVLGDAAQGFTQSLATLDTGNVDPM